MEKKLIDPFVFLFERDLDKLDSEIRQYPNDDALWTIAGETKNPAGNLCLHLCGNLQHYIGAQLGNTGYQRNRALEFSAKAVSKDALLQEIRQTKQAVSKTLKNLTDESLQKLYPEEVLGYPMTTVFFLTHLIGHFGYHLGQINYHRRLLSKK